MEYEIITYHMDGRITKIKLSYNEGKDQKALDKGYKLFNQDESIHTFEIYLVSKLEKHKIFQFN